MTYKVTENTNAPTTDKYGQIFTAAGRRSPKGGLYLPPGNGPAKPVRKGSARHRWLEALAKGATLAQQSKATGWSIGTVRSGLHWAVNAEMGYGVKAAAAAVPADRVYRLIYPEGQKAVAVRTPAPPKPKRPPNGPPTKTPRPNRRGVFYYQNPRPNRRGFLLPNPPRPPSGRP